MADKTTLDCYDPPATICRERGWRTGTLLIGDEGYGPTIIEITAIGERAILAKQISRNGKPPRCSDESLWSLDCRDWQETLLPEPPK